MGRGMVRLELLTGDGPRRGLCVFCELVVAFGNDVELESSVGYCNHE